jgi:hypothetical protein
MTKTMDLLDKALAIHPAPYWHDRLRLNRNALHNARQRGHISPAIAGALASELGQDPKEWIVVAALESERDSACKTQMIKQLMGTVRKLYLSTRTRLSGGRKTPAA